MPASFCCEIPLAGRPSRAKSKQVGHTGTHRGLRFQAGSLKRDAQLPPDPSPVFRPKYTCIARAGTSALHINGRRLAGPHQSALAPSPFLPSGRWRPWSPAHLLRSWTGKWSALPPSPADTTHRWSVTLRRQVSPNQVPILTFFQVRP